MTPAVKAAQDLDALTKEATSGRPRKAFRRRGPGGHSRHRHRNRRPAPAAPPHRPPGLDRLGIAAPDLPARRGQPDDHRTEIPVVAPVPRRGKPRPHRTRTSQPASRRSARAAAGFPPPAQLTRGVTSGPRGPDIAGGRTGSGWTPIRPVAGGDHHLVCRLRHLRRPADPPQTSREHGRRAPCRG